MTGDAVPGAFPFALSPLRHDQPIDTITVAERLQTAPRLVALTGGGVSVASGLDIVGDDGPDRADRGLRSASTRDTWKRDLGALWARWGAVRAAAMAAEPNAAHLALAAHARRAAANGGSLVVATQNVDGLHARAGSPSIVELHGSVLRSRCTGAGCGPAFTDERVPAPGEVPGCTRCGGPCRPDVVLFGETLRASDWRRVSDRVRSADAVLVAGLSGVVYPASGLVNETRAGTLRVLTNTDVCPDAADRFDAVVVGRCEETLSVLLGTAVASAA